jgi:hypothetical protein
MNISDYYGAILDKRMSVRLRDYIPVDDQRRMKACQVLGLYMYGSSKYAQANLAASYSADWVETGLVYKLATAMGDLVTLGMRPNVEDKKQLKKINMALSRCAWYRTVRKFVRDAGAFGDSIMEVGWDDQLRQPTLTIYLSAMYLPFPDRSGCVVFYGLPHVQDQIHVTMYFKGVRADKGPDGLVRMQAGAADNQAVGVVSGWVDDTADKPLHERLKGAGRMLPTTGIPVFHMPCGDVDRLGFGTSDFWSVLSLVDCYGEVVTDQRRASRFIIPPGVITGDQPPRGSSGEKEVQLNYKAQTFYYVGQTGDMKYMDNSTLMAAAEKRRVELFDQTVEGIGMCKAMLGNVGDVSNRRDREVRLMYMPGRNKVIQRREDVGIYLPAIQQAMEETWRAFDKRGYEDAFGSLSLGDMEWMYDDVLPEDVQERIAAIAASRSMGALDRETASRDVLGTLRIEGDAKKIAATAAAEESAALGITAGEPPADGDDPQQ